jgi:hypothetical protein
MLQNLFLALVCITISSHIVTFDLKSTFNPLYPRNTYCRLNCEKFGFKVKKYPLIVQLNETIPNCIQFQPGSESWISNRENSFKTAPQRIRALIDKHVSVGLEKILRDLHNHYLQLRQKCFDQEICDKETFMSKIPFPATFPNSTHRDLLEEMNLMMKEDESLCPCESVARSPKDNYFKDVCKTQSETVSTDRLFESCNQIYLKTNYDDKGVYTLTNGEKYYCTRGWTLVRRMYSQWAVNDNLKGDLTTGTPMNNATGPDDWSLPFSHIPFSTFKFETGDGTKWALVEKKYLYGEWKDHGIRKVIVLKSHLTAKPVEMFWRKGPSGYPLVQVKNTTGDLPRMSDLLYGESDLPSEQWANWRDRHNGINVWIK